MRSLPVNQSFSLRLHTLYGAISHCDLAPLRAWFLVNFEAFAILIFYHKHKGFAVRPSVIPKNSEYLSAFLCVTPGNYF